MLADQRRQLIRREIADRGSVVAADLAARLGVSEDTIRRDLRELARSGACARVYGGALAPAPAAGPIGARVASDVAAKLRLARAAVPLLAPGSTVFIDAGSTNLAIAHAIPQEAELTVATNAVDVAAALAGHAGVELIVLGGRFARDLGACLGAEALRQIGQIAADIFVLGSCGVDAGRGATAFDPAEAEVKRAMAAARRAVLVAATTAKLGTAAPFRVAAPEAIRHLVVEADAPADRLDQFAHLGAAIHRA